MEFTLQIRVWHNRLLSLMGCCVLLFVVVSQQKKTPWSCCLLIIALTSIIIQWTFAGIWCMMTSNSN